MMLFLVFLLVAYGSDKNWEFHTFDQNSGMFVQELGGAQLSSSSWVMIVYYEMSTYWKEWDYLCGTTKHLQNWCHDISKSNQTLFKGRCDTLIEPLRITINTIKERNQILKSSKRTRRAPLEIVGSVLHGLFGVLDSETGERYEQMIQQSQGNIEHMEELLAKQMHIIDVSSTILKKQIQLMQEEHDIIRAEINTIVLHEELIDSIVHIATLINHIQDIQNVLLEVLFTAHHGQVSPKLLSQTLLEQQVQMVERQLEGDIVKIPLVDQWAELYKVLTARAGVYNEQLIVEVNCPLVFADEFNIYKVHPLPTQHNNMLVYADVGESLLVMNQQRTWFYLLLITELRLCTKTTKYYICQQERALSSTRTPELPCEVQMLLHPDKVLEACNIKKLNRTTYLQPISKHNDIICITLQPYRLDLLCKRAITSINIHGEGILHYKGGCSIKTADRWFPSNNIYNTTAPALLLPEVNLSWYLNKHEVPITTGDFAHTLQQLDEELEKMHQHAPWDQPNRHDKVHYIGSVMVYIFIIMWVIITIWLWRRSEVCFFPKLRKSKHRASGTSVRQDVEQSTRNLEII